MLLKLRSYCIAQCSCTCISTYNNRKQLISIAVSMVCIAESRSTIYVPHAAVSNELLSFIYKVIACE